MNNQKDSEQKKRFPGGFLLFLLAAILVILTVQHLSSDKGGKVSFTHQVEHLVNLDLIHKGESRKTALNDNLVTFNGKFQDRLTTDAKDRYRFLELLNENHELLQRKQSIAKALGTLDQNVRDSAERFLQLSGLPILKGGYVVVSPVYDTDDRENGIVLQSLSELSTVNLVGVHSRLTHAIDHPTVANIDRVGKDLSVLIQNFRSSALGIGDEKLKQTLTDLNHKVDESLTATSLTLEEKLATYQMATAGVSGIVRLLDAEKDNVRLFQLRYVRNYLVDLNQYNHTIVAVDKNEAELDKARQSIIDAVWFFNNKELSTKALERQETEEYGLWFAHAKQEWMAFSTNRGTVFKAPDQPRSAVLEKTFKSQESSPNYLSYIFTILPALLVIFLLYFIFSRQMKGMGSGAMSFGKSPAKKLEQSLMKVTFKDVAGVDEAKQELEEIVEFLKDPLKYTALGARIPKGVLCVGPPGTGKTLIAKAVAGEAGRPFFSISGSDFVEMFVGVGASRIRDLFAQAKKEAPCIVFIDEIDAVGRHRGAGIGGGHDEREQTLNQLLVEMDGFGTNEGVILIAATNRPDVLDKALLRAGRFDRRVVLDLPDLKGRFEILKVHVRKIKMDSSVDLMAIARNTPGCSGADLMNILNEAALLAARYGRSSVTGPEALEACDKVRYGKERRSLELREKDRLHTAYHESGHAIVGLFVEFSDPVEKVTIVPRGMSLGATHFVPETNKVSYWKKELLDKLAVFMGGRVAEDIFIGDFSSGAQMDITQATSLARSMVCEWGMTGALGAVSYEESHSEGQYFMPGESRKNYSEETAKNIDDEVRKLLDRANQQAIQIITDNKEKVQLMTNMLLEFETLDHVDVKAIADGTWDIEKKKSKIEKSIHAHRKTPPPLPKDIKLDKGTDPIPQSV